eukprot:12308107-Heterocapsa_arctica.AAC.1
MWASGQAGWRVGRQVCRHGAQANRVGAVWRRCRRLVVIVVVRHRRRRRYGIITYVFVCIRVRIDSTQTHDQEAEESAELDMRMALDEEGLKEVAGEQGIFGGGGAGVLVPMTSEKATENFQEALAKIEGTQSTGGKLKAGRGGKPPGQAYYYYCLYSTYHKGFQQHT